MIAWLDRFEKEATEGTIIGRGEWVVIHTAERARIALKSPDHQERRTNGFRIPAINPAKRVKSRKQKRRR